MGQLHSRCSSLSNSRQRHHLSSLPPTQPSNNVNHGGQPMSYPPVAQNIQVQRSTYGHFQETQHSAMLTGNPAVAISQQSGSSVNRQHTPQRYADDACHTGILLNPDVPDQNYHPTGYVQPILQPQLSAPPVTTQRLYPYPPNPAMRAQSGHTQYSNPSSPSPHTCVICKTTFTPPRGLKRRLKPRDESQRTTIEHVCKDCQKKIKWH